MTGTLYLVSTPIGNPEDLTLRGRRVLEQADVIICEEARTGSTLLHHYGLVRPLVELNEHTEESETPTLLERLVKGESMTLISDHGTPLLEDPGAALVRGAISSGIPIVPVPGASAVTAAVVASGLPANRFRFLGRLPQKAEARRRALSAHRETRETLVLLDAPYRLMPLLRSLALALGQERRSAVACNLTTDSE
ncbi:MAG: SAM-dependent methyltransferase, partial [Rudaea sp.]